MTRFLVLALPIICVACTQKPSATEDNQKKPIASLSVGIPAAYTSKAFSSKKGIQITLTNNSLDRSLVIYGSFSLYVSIYVEELGKNIPRNKSIVRPAIYNAFVNLPPSGSHTEVLDTAEIFDWARAKPGSYRMRMKYSDRIANEAAKKYKWSGTSKVGEIFSDPFEIIVSSNGTISLKGKL